MIKFRNNSYISDEQFYNIIVESKRQTQGLFSSIIENIEDVQFDNCINEAILDINQNLLNHVNDLMQLNRKDELLDDLNRYFDNCTEGKVDYEVDKLGLMSNSLSGADRERQLIVVKEYFTFCLYRLFYLELIPKIVKALPPQQQPNANYWDEEIEDEILLEQFENAVYQIFEKVEAENELGCFPLRFRMLPRVVLSENTYSIERKKYLLKRMRLVLDEVKNTEIGRELFTDLYERIEPYADIFRFVFSETPLPPQPIDKEQNRTKKVIAETFENMDKKGWQYAFATIKDYNLFTDLLTNFFEYKDYSIPNTVIQLKRTCKTKVAKALGEIHAELSENPLKSDTEYFNIVKVLNHFKDVSNFDLVKAMQR